MTDLIISAPILEVGQVWLKDCKFIWVSPLWPRQLGSKGLSKKDFCSQGRWGLSAVRIFLGEWGFFRCGRPQFLVKKT